MGEEKGAPESVLRSGQLSHNNCSLAIECEVGGLKCKIILDTESSITVIYSDVLPPLRGTEPVVGGSSWPHMGTVTGEQPPVRKWE